MAVVEGDSGMSRIAFLGTGLLGSGMVEAMLRRHLDVAVWNRTESKARALEALGATVASTPEEAVAGAAEVHMALSDDAAVDQMMARIADRLGPETIVADLTTTSPAGTRDRLAAAARRGIRFLHAPVFMSPQMCRDAQGLMLVSGPAEVFAATKDALAKMKIFGNSMLFVITAGIADVFAMAKHVGVAPEDAAGLFSKFRVGGIIPQRAEKLARGDFEATFELTMARKDIRLMIEAAGREPLVVLPSIARRMDEAIASGYGKADMGAIAAASVQVPR
jgi:3-hydroxyisobutyrate dehydrogenase-like beta-hydroxyacid dehydrogenase